MAVFKLNAGMHTQREPVVVQEEGKPDTTEIQVVSYAAGQTFESDSEVCFLDRNKFELVSGERKPAAKRVVTHRGHPLASPSPVKPPPVNFDRLSQKELVDYAVSEEIDLKGAKGKDDMIRAIKAALTGK